MKLRIDFGLYGPRKEVTWWQPLEDFPTGLFYDNQRWTWSIYKDDPYKAYDKILTFELMAIGDQRWYNCTDFQARFGFNSGCECGSIHTSAPQFHMFYCPMWRKV